VPTGAWRYSHRRFRLAVCAMAWCFLAARTQAAWRTGLRVRDRGTRLANDSNRQRTRERSA
jgi:hypothetical protein